MASRALEVYAPVGRARRIEVPAHPSMSTVNVERVGPAISPAKKLGTTSLTGRNGILCRYFYFAMSLLLAAIVVAGLQAYRQRQPVSSRPAAALHSLDSCLGFHRVGDLLYLSVRAGPNT
jgi:hypothetical protein